ncbi:hypothetical protein FO519_010207, partial [Halicephalobus sp. NKZ332]
MTLSNDIDNGNCTFINEIYFGKHKIYIYRVENSTILKRWLVTSDGELTNSSVIKRTKFPIEYVFLHSKLIEISTREDNSWLLSREDCEDLPRCDIPGDGISCEEDQDFEETPKMFFVSYDNFVGERDGKNYTITKYNGYSDPDRLTLVVRESNGIFRRYLLSTCGEQRVSHFKRSINGQGTHLYIHFENSINNYLLIVNLAALSDKISNGNCVSTDATYFGKHKIYVYRVENSTILKRWLLTP